MTSIPNYLFQILVLVSLCTALQLRSKTLDLYVVALLSIWSIGVFAIFYRYGVDQVLFYSNDQAYFKPVIEAIPEFGIQFSLWNLGGGDYPITLPALLLTIVAGFILGLPWGFCAVLVGATLGSCLAFLNSRFLLKSWVDEHLIGRYPQLSAFSEVIRKNQFKVVLLLRLSPLVPYNVLNYCLAVMPLDFWPYLLASFFGMLSPPAPLVLAPSQLLSGD